MRNIFNKFIILYSQREHAPFENTAVPDTDLRTLPTIQFKILNKPITDTLLCIYDHVFLLGQLITNDKDYGYIIPCRYAYANNILHISIVKYNFSGMYGYSLLEGEINANKWPCEKGVDIVGIEIKDKYENNTMTLKRFSVRMFNQEKVIIQYDYATGDLQVLFTNP